MTGAGWEVRPLRMLCAVLIAVAMLPASDATTVCHRQMSSALCLVVLHLERISPSCKQRPSGVAVACTAQCACLCNMHRVYIGACGRLRANKLKPRPCAGAGAGQGNRETGVCGQTGGQLFL